MSLPERRARRKPKRPNYVGGYADVVHAYREQGWPSVLPLPPGQKSPPPTGFTCNGARIPTPEQVEKWRRERPDANVALALVECDDWDFDLLGVDIDNYAKGDRPAGRAMEVIAEVEGRAGARFPATRYLTHRDDGSGIWVYRVPRGLLWRSKLGPGVELLHKGHRYIAVGINPVTKKHKQWKSADRRLLKVPPQPQEFTWLPDELVLELMRDVNGTDVPGLATPEAANALLGDLPDGVMNAGVRALMTRALADLSGLNGSRHDATLSHVRDLVKYGAAGLAGTVMRSKRCARSLLRPCGMTPSGAAAKLRRPSSTEWWSTPGS